MQLPSAFPANHTARHDWRDRLRGALIHLRLSALLPLTPFTELLSRFSAQATAIDAALSQAGRQGVGTAYLPLIVRKGQAWTVLLHSGTAAIVGFLPLDSF